MQQSSYLRMPHWCFGRVLGFADGFFMGTAPSFVRWRCAQYDGIVALAACEHFGRSRRVIPMMMVVLMAGIGLLLAGLVTVGLGIQMELSFGNTLILTGAIARSEERRVGKEGRCGMV